MVSSQPIIIRYSVGNTLPSNGPTTQSHARAAKDAAVLTGLAITAVWPGGWWVDPVIGLGVAAVAVWEGIESWRGQGCEC